MRWRVRALEQKLKQQCRAPIIVLALAACISHYRHLLLVEPAINSAVKVESIVLGYIMRLKNDECTIYFYVSF